MVCKSSGKTKIDTNNININKRAIVIGGSNENATTFDVNTADTKQNIDLEYLNSMCKIYNKYVCSVVSMFICLSDTTVTDYYLSPI